MTTVAMVSVGLAWCFIYVTYCTWSGAIENADELANRHPYLVENWIRWGKGLPIPVTDYGLPALTPRPTPTQTVLPEKP